MSINDGTSLDMAGISDNVLSFVEDKDAQNFGISYEYQVGSGAGMANSVPTDINDLNMGDIWSGIEQAGKSVYETGKSVLQNVGLISKETIQQSPEPIPTPIKPEEKKEEVLPEKQGSEQVKQLQEYFANPDPLLQSFIGNLKYTGKIDGIPGPLTNNVVNALEMSLIDLLDSNNIRGVILRTSVDDIKGALAKAAEYIKYKKEKMAISLNRDERIYRLSKLKIQYAINK